MLGSEGNQLTLLTLMVALSAYLSGVRFYLLDKLKRPEADTDKASDRKKQLFRLALIDAPLVTSATLLAFRLSEPYVTRGYFSLDWWITTLFLTAVLVMFLYHLAGWFTSFDQHLQLGLAAKAKRAWQAYNDWYQRPFL